MTTPRPAGRPRPAPMRVTVARAQWLAPRMRRITFAGPELARFAWPGPGSHFKVVIPEPGAALVLPEPDAEGMVRYDPAVPLTMRTYTPRALRPAGPAGVPEIDVDFVVHGHGPAATWAAAVQPGDAAALGPARARYDLDPAAAGLLLGGDESAVPAIGTILAARPAGLPARVYLEVHDESDQPALAEAGDPAVSVTWLVRTGAGAGTAAPGDLLATALRAAGTGDGTRVWVGCEAHVVRGIRRDLLDRGVPREAMVTRGYWRTGVANHPDGDYGDGEIPTRAAN